MKKALTLLTVLGLSLAGSTLFAQEKTVLHFQDPESFKGLITYPLMKVENVGQFKGIPTDTLEAAVYVMNLQRNQSVYTNMLKGYYSKEYFDNIANLYKTDTTNIYKKADIVNALLVFSAMLPNNRKIFIPDLNNNGDFSDDEAFEFTVTDFNREFPLDSAKMLEFDYDFYHVGRIYKRHLKFKLVPTNKGYGFKDPQTKRLMVYTKRDGRMLARSMVSGTKYLFTIMSPVEADYESSDLVVRNMAKDSTLRFNPTLKTSDVFTLEGKRIKFDEVAYFGDSAILTFLPPGTAMIGVR